LVHRCYGSNNVPQILLQARVSFFEYDLKDITMSSIYLATKIEETPRKIRDIASVFDRVFKIQENHPRPIPVLDVTSQNYYKMKNTIVEAEKYLLKELGFELFRLTDHPQKYMINYVKMLRSRKETAQKAWYYCNDSFRKALCAHYPPNVIAVSCIYLAMRVLNYPFVNVVHGGQFLKFQSNRYLKFVQK